MPLTAHSDIFASFHEEGFNRILRHIQLQRPSLFNYATATIEANPELLCRVIRVHPIVDIRSNPHVTIVEPLPIPGTAYGVNYAVQVVKASVDFHPGNGITLPPELSPPLAAQRLAIAMTVCVGLGCPPKETVEKYVPPPPQPDHKDRSDRAAPRGEVIPIPTRQLICFCLDVFAVGGVRTRYYDGRPYLEPFVDTVEIVDIKPPGLENTLECYVFLLLKLAVLPGLRMLLEVAPLRLMENVSVVLKPTPPSGTVPNNPAVESDELRAFVDVEVI